MPRANADAGSASPEDQHTPGGGLGNEAGVSRFFLTEQTDNIADTLERAGVARLTTAQRLLIKCCLGRMALNPSAAAVRETAASQRSLALFGMLLVLGGFAIGISLQPPPMPLDDARLTAYACRKAGMVMRGDTNIFGQVVQVHCADEGSQP